MRRIRLLDDHGATVDEVDWLGFDRVHTFEVKRPCRLDAVVLLWIRKVLWPTFDNPFVEPGMHVGVQISGDVL